MEQIVELDITENGLLKLFGDNDLATWLYFSDSTLLRCFQQSRKYPILNMIVTELETNADGKPGNAKRTYVWESQHPILCLDEREFFYRKDWMYPDDVLRDYTVISSFCRYSFSRCCPPETNCDKFVVRIREDSFRVCRNRLCAESEYFAALFRTEWKETRANECRFDDLSQIAFCNLISYLKWGQLYSFESAKNLYMLADRFIMPKLTKLCEHRMLADLNEDNKGDVIRLATIFGTPKFRNRLAEWTTWRFHSSSKPNLNTKHYTMRGYIGGVVQKDVTKANFQCCNFRIAHSEAHIESHHRRRHAIYYDILCVEGVHCRLKALSHIREPTTESASKKKKLVNPFPTVLSLMEYYQNVCIRIQDWNFTICKADLCSESAYFNAVFKNEIREYRIDNVDPKMFSLLIKYIYHGELKDTDRVISILMLANRFQMTDIMIMCGVWLAKQCTRRRLRATGVDDLKSYRTEWTS